MVSTFVDEVDILAIARRFDRTEYLAGHDIGKAENGRQWGAQFMGHIGEESRFATIGLIGGTARAVAVLGQSRQFRRLLLQLSFRQFELCLPMLQCRDIGADADIATIGRSMVADQGPAAILDNTFTKKRLIAGKN